MIHVNYQYSLGAIFCQQTATFDQSSSDRRDSVSCALSMELILFFSSHSVRAIVTKNKSKSKIASSCRHHVVLFCAGYGELSFAIGRSGETGSKSFWPFEKWSTQPAMHYSAEPSTCRETVFAQPLAKTWHIPVVPGMAVSTN